MNLWNEDYNHNRRHSSLGNKTPTEYAQMIFNKIKLGNLAT
ncbi:MAG: transposase [Caulobacterales bacterium]|nr:transposase [Caulobacterales bacterium]